MVIKEQLLKFCWDYVGEKSQRLKNSHADLQESLDSETKNSTGDKHETGRAMVQLEQEKLAQQFMELEKIKNILQRVDVRKRTETIGLGSLAKTTAADYFIAISAGAFKQEGKPIYCVSQEAPIAQLLIRKRAKPLCSMAIPIPFWKWVKGGLMPKTLFSDQFQLNMHPLF